MTTKHMLLMIFQSLNKTCDFSSATSPITLLLFSLSISLSPSRFFSQFISPHPAFTLSPSLLLTVSDTKVLETKNGRQKVSSCLSSPVGLFLHGGR